MTIKYDDILLYYYLSVKGKDGKKFIHSKYDGIFTLGQFLNGRKGKQSYVEDIERLREAEYHSKEYNEIKKRLPLFWICAKSLSGYRRKSDITTNYNIFSIDVDYQDNKELFDKYGIDIIKNDLFEQIKSCFCAMTSCGGQGIVLYILLDNVTTKNEKQYFAYWEQTFKDAGINIDTQTKDILTRARYISYDKDKLLREDVEPFKLPNNFIKKYIKDEKRHIDNYEINSREDIKYLDNVRRYKYCYTLKKLFGKEAAERITKEIYDIYYNGTSDRAEAYHHIEASCANNTEYIDENIYRELILLGIIKEDIKNESLMTIELKENEEGNQWVYDYKDKILNFLTIGVNSIVAPPGSGKTEFWNQLSINDNKRICVVEPFTSVVDGKYDKNTTNIAAGLGNLIDNEAHYTATNYLKFTLGVKNNIQRYDYLVIDESHMLGTQDYRAAGLLEFIEAVKTYMKKYPDSKIILQTGTPANEDIFFNINKTIIIKKEIKKFVQIHYTITNVYKETKKDDEGNNVEIYENNKIKTILHYARMYRNEGRKVYIYWGSGSISDMKNYAKAENILNEENAAIYHTRNKGNEDMEYITKERKMGKYDILMTSCYFSVGCDLNDESNTAIIIIGNNPYQEDEQVIGRFRKSKNIKVNIILDNNIIYKHDVSKILQLKEENAILINESKNIRNKSSLLKKYSRDNEIYLTAYIECSKYYYSDLERKFEYYKEKNYNVVNIIRQELVNGKEIIYEVCENTKEGIMPVVYLIDYKEDTLRQIIKDRKNLIQNIKEDIYNELICDNELDLMNIKESSKDKPSLTDWIDALIMFKNHYNINEILNKIDKKTILALSKTKMNDLIHFKIMLEKNKTDYVEENIIKKIIEIYDGLEDKNYIEIYMALYYCMWCQYFEEDKNYTYDMMKVHLTYPVYNEWRTRILNIVKVNKDIREYILNYKNNNELDILSPSYIFLKDIIENETIESIKNDYEIFKNKYIHKTYYKKFIEYIVRLKFGTREEKQSIKGKNGGKKGKEITIDGKVYETIKDAAEQLGISRQALYKRLKH